MKNTEFDFDFGGFDFDPMLGPDQQEQEMPQDMAKAVNDEISEYERAFRERAKAEDKRKKDALDCRYYFCAYFATKTQRDQFLSAIDVLAKLHNNYYLCGDDLARAIGVELEDAGLKTPAPFKRPKGVDDWIFDE